MKRAGTRNMCFFFFTWPNVAFQRKTEIAFVRNINSHRFLFQTLIVRFGYRRLRHFEPEHAALGKSISFSIC